VLLNLIEVLFRRMNFYASITASALTEKTKRFPKFQQRLRHLKMWRKSTAWRGFGLG